MIRPICYHLPECLVMIRNCSILAQLHDLFIAHDAGTRADYAKFSFIL